MKDLYECDGFDDDFVPELAEPTEEDAQRLKAYRGGCNCKLLKLPVYEECSVCSTPPTMREIFWLLAQRQAHAAAQRPEGWGDW